MTNTVFSNGWLTVPLSDLLMSLETGSRPKGGVRGITAGIPSLGGEHLDSNGGFKLDNIRYVPLEFAELMTRGAINNGDILVVKDGATTGKVSFVDNSFPLSIAVVNEHVFLCRCSSLLNSKYIFFYLFSNSGNQQILEDFRGAAQGGISQRFADLVKVPLAPAAEQTRIVEKLEELFSDLDAGVAELKAAQKKLAQYRQSLLKAAVEGSLTAEWRTKNTPKETGAQLLERILKERRARWEEKQLARFKEQAKTPPKGWQDKYPEPVQPDTTNLPELPEGWVWASVDQVGEVFLGKMLDKTKHQTGAMLPYLRNISVRWGSIETHDLPEMYYEEDELERYGLASGDVLVCEGGEPGRAAVCGKEHEKLKYQKALHRVRLFSLYESDLLVFYLEHLAKTGMLEQYFTGSTIKHFTKESFIALPIPLPPICEQSEIVEHLKLAIQCAQEQDAAIIHSLTQAAAQRKNILKSAFSGQLVLQAPNDEPASLLLERIRAERQKGESSTKKRSSRKKVAKL
ncbi:restriction endonuclease subunit S [Trichlorobacter lovleyi]|uniref:Restriction modification system DNA specificity domain n=1 Tax=Trichlorobacter lovleyi (strain ATCC BAA-1151 / DSM 17278 / SZ) TaxID=398767 RepID=B3E2V8_TRIL1|nr:restriction endonuclease subunit S [Trichlorobacter lovleyi]ACD97218.1 restriction modification system DNA specificity domain [Trichlorobacter lovleyi SZ]